MHFTALLADDDAEELFGLSFLAGTETKKSLEAFERFKVWERGGGG